MMKIPSHLLLWFWLVYALAILACSAIVAPWMINKGGWLGMAILFGGVVPLFITAGIYLIRASRQHKEIK